MTKSVLASVTGAALAALKSNLAPPDELPIFPLGQVLFPGGTMALKIFEQRYLEMAKVCLKTGSPFGIVLIREGNEVGIPAAPESVGTLAHVSDWDMQNLGVLQVRVKGSTRFKILSESASKSGLIIGQILTLPDDMHIDCPEHLVCANFLRKVFAQLGLGGGVDEQQFDDAAWVSYRVAEILPFSGAVKQKLLELTDARIRLEILHRFLSDQGLIE